MTKKSRVFRLDECEFEFNNGDKETWCIEVDADFTKDQHDELRKMVETVDFPEMTSFKVRVFEGTLSCGRTFLMYKEGFSLPEIEN